MNFKKSCSFYVNMSTPNPKEIRTTFVLFQYSEKPRGKVEQKYALAWLAKLWLHQRTNWFYCAFLHNGQNIFKAYMISFFLVHLNINLTSRLSFLQFVVYEISNWMTSNMKSF